VTLAAGANANVTVRITAPLDPLTPAGLNHINVTATSRGNTSVVAADMLEVDVEQIYQVSIKASPLRQSVDPGTNALYNVTVTNDGNGRDTFVLSMEGARRAWGRLSQTQVTLDAGAERIVVLTVRIPSNQPVEDAVVIVNATSSGGDSVTAKATTSTTINAFFGVTLTISNDEKPAFPSRFTVFTVKVKNTGNSQDTFNFEVTGDYASWVAEMAPLTIDAGKTKNLEVNITPPSDVANGVYTFTINGSSDTVGDAYDLLDLTVNINVFYRMVVTLDQTEVNSSPDATETVLVFVENTANVNDTFDVRALGQYANWVSIDNTTLDADEGATAVATATIDVNASQSGNYLIRFEVTSHGGGNVSEAELTIIIDLRYGVSLVAVKETIPSGNNMSVDAEVELTNEGNTEDTYKLKVVGLPGSLWDAELQIDELTMMGGEVAWFNVTVDVPPGVRAGNYVVQVRATSTMSPVSLARTIPLNITVAFGVNATGPADKVNVMPGEEELVQITVENTGLGPDIVVLEPVAPFQDWADPVQAAVMLLPGESKIVDILITPPEDSLTGTYVVQIKATSRADLEVSSFADVRVGVGQVYAVLVEPGSSFVEGPVSVWHDVDLTVTNLGNGEDTITLDAIVPGGVDIEARFDQSIVTLAGGKSTEVTLRVRADKDLEADAYVIDVTARSSSSSVPVYHVYVTYTLPEVHSVDIKTDSGLDEANIVGAVIGRDYQVTFEVFNLGNAQDSYGISALSEDAGLPSWFSFEASRLTVPAGESRMMIATISVPSDALAGLYTFDIQAKSESANASALLAGSVEVSTYRAVTISTDNFESTVDPSGGTGDSARFVFEVKNLGNMAETVTLEVSYPSGWGLPVITPESVKVDPFSDTTITLEFPPSSVPASAAPLNGISVKARYGALESAVVTLTVRVLKPDVKVLTVTTSTDTPLDGDLVDVSITLQNSGQVDATGLTVILLANEVEVGRVQGQSVTAGGTRDVLITWDVDEGAGASVILKVRVPEEDITYSHPNPIEVKEEDDGFLSFFDDMSFYMLISIGLVLGLILGLLIAVAVRSGTKKRLADAHAAGMAEGMALASAEADEEKKEEEPEPEEEADGDEDEPYDEMVPMEEGDEEGGVDEDVAPVVVQCPQCDTYNNVTTGQRPYEFRCEKCNALLRLKD
jgi:uncharacterized membrane protein